MRIFPALRIAFFETPTEEQVDLLLAALDDYRPTAINEIGNGLLVFFNSAATRDAALADLVSYELVDVVAEDVPDEQWAERSQAALTPVTVEQITVAPPWCVTDELRNGAAGPVIVIHPSMGFGTGHHASTRLCLELLQRIPVRGMRVLDMGTGSGVLAIAARLLGAAEVVGADIDPDALANARENLALNPGAAGVTFRELDLSAPPGSASSGYDVILANLTGAMLQREAPRLTGLSAARAHLIVSGFQEDEAAAVVGAFPDWKVREERAEETWVGAWLSR